MTDRGLLVVGDADCRFNPIYGQGMTVAACEALALRDCLRQGPTGLGFRFRMRTDAIVDIPWEIAVGSDLRFTTGSIGGSSLLVGEMTVAGA